MIQCIHNEHVDGESMREKEEKVCSPKCLVHQIFHIQSCLKQNCNCSRGSVLEPISNTKFYEMIPALQILNEIYKEVNTEVALRYPDKT